MRAHMLLAGVSLLVLAGCSGEQRAEPAGARDDPGSVKDTSAAPHAAHSPAPAEVGTPAARVEPPVARRDPDPAASPDLGTRIYFRHCVVCHGPAGRGDGPGLLAPDPRPPDFLDHGYMSSRSDSALLRSIRRGKGEAAMPRWDRILTEDEMKAVLGFVRRFGKATPVRGGTERP